MNLPLISEADAERNLNEKTPDSEETGVSKAFTEHPSFEGRVFDLPLPTSSRGSSVAIKR